MAFSFDGIDSNIFLDILKLWLFTPIRWLWDWFYVWAGIILIAWFIYKIKRLKRIHTV